jgi:hypothetical protein
MDSLWIKQNIIDSVCAIGSWVTWSALYFSFKRVVYTRMNKKKRKRWTEAECYAKSQIGVCCSSFELQQQLHRLISLTEKMKDSTSSFLDQQATRRWIKGVIQQRCLQISWVRLYHHMGNPRICACLRAEN